MLHRSVVASALALGMTFCQVAEDDLLEVAESATEHAVYYELDFSDDGVERTDDGLLIVTNLGYRVALHEGRLSTSAAQLVPCRSASAWFGARVAYAGHTVGDGDPSAVEGPLVEPLVAAAASELGSALSDRSYCAIGLSVGPSEELEGFTLSLELSVETPAGWAPRSLTSMSGFTRQAELGQTVDSGSAAAKLVVERKLATMFDDVDFDGMTDEVIADRVLVNLLSQADILVYTD